MAKIAVTGASGYIASWVVKKLIEEGHTVHGTVRSLTNETKIAHLKKIEGKGSLKLFKADLLEANSFEAAFKDCDIVMHTASPFYMSRTSHNADSYKLFIDPALKGTENVLSTVSKFSSIKKVVLTSSIAAMLGNLKELDGKPVTEKSWNNTSSPKDNPYSYSKKVAEARAWEIAKAQDKWKLVVINPGLVLGPSLTQASDSGSQSIVDQIIKGQFSRGVPNLAMGIVSVQDVAEAHMRAAFSEHAEGRYVLSDKVMNFMDVVNILRPHYENKISLPASNKIIPKFLVWLLAPTIGLSRSFVSGSVGQPLSIDNSKSKKDLGIEYGNIEQAIIDHIAQALELK